MIPIKFRGKTINSDTGASEWSYTSMEASCTWEWDIFWHAIDLTTLGQFTTRLDANGKGIYAGDICMVIETHEAFNGDRVSIEIGPYTVYWDDDRWGLKDEKGMDYDNGDYYQGDIIDWNKCKVVGNIHEKQPI